mmetsp:Transcript_26895/g.58808  ORF Transcript_26895/g.58808 Transcript_26895/m.58808 type:complete len:543 (+) Transcript_26895:117-1745(+)
MLPSDEQDHPVTWAIVLPINLPTAIAVCVGAVSLALVFFNGRTRDRLNSASIIPTATESKYFLGQALAYKKDPAAFLLRQYESVGSIFRINLAGRRMTVLCGSGKDMEMNLVKKVATMPERLLSAREAVSDIGFEYTLGKANVFEGTDFHKRLIKNHLNGDPDTVPRLVYALQEAYKIEIDDKTNGEMIIVQDFLGLVRRCTIRTVINVFLGSAFLRPPRNKRDTEGEGGFIDDFILLQDDIEKATAAAAVLPRWLSLPLVLRPVERSRLKMQKLISKRILDAWCSPLEEQGPWLKDFRDNGISLDRASEYVVGLLFAAHKNPAIGSAQSYLFLRLDGTENERDAVECESKALLKSPSVDILMQQCHSIRRCCLETLRLTSHALGAIRTAREEISLGKCPVASNTSRNDDGIRQGQDIVLCPGDVVAISHIVPNLDKHANMWGDDAERYNPSRTEWTNEDSYPDDYKFSTFSQGLHKCPGQQIALYIMQINVAILFGLYDIEFVGQVPPVSFERATLAQRDGDVCVNVSKRAEALNALTDDG